jgi:hypothetical protein
MGQFFLGKWDVTVKRRHGITIYDKKDISNITTICVQDLPERQASFVVYQAREIQFFGQAFQDVAVQGPKYLLY